VSEREPAVIEALYFDGRSARGRPVRLRVAEGLLIAEAAADRAAEAAAHLAAEHEPTAQWPLAEVRWPERTRHGQRVLQLHGGGTLAVADAAAFDAWRRALGAREGWVVRVQQNWRATTAAVVALLLVVAAGYQWGVPAAAQALLRVVPQAVDDAVGAAALQSIQSQWLSPSALPPARQAQLRAAFAAAVAAAYPAGPRPRWELHFHAAGKALGANAFALPGGTIVITDAMVELLQGSDDTVIGVLAHELGHVQHRHGMRAVVQFALVGAATAVALGDFSTLLAGVPALVAQMGYSRDAEREADAHAAFVLRASGRSPVVMVLLFDRLAAAHGGTGVLPFALASHPPDAQRRRLFQDAAR
jgi:Zn-dependent protease with chaperone function